MSESQGAIKSIPSRKTNKDACSNVERTANDPEA